MKVKNIEISDDAAAVLRAGSWQESLFILPPGQLDRKLYQAVDAVLRALGGKWNRGKGGHLFTNAASFELRAALDAGGLVDVKKTYEQFFTPADLAGRMHAALNIREGETVLEPSAGNGRLVWEALERGAKVTAVEIDNTLAAELRGKHNNLFVVTGDFLALRDYYGRSEIDAVIMNPPFSGNQDIAHVRHAFDLLKAGGRLCAITSPHWTFANDKASTEFRTWISEHGADLTTLDSGVFAEAGTMVRSVMVYLEKPL